MHTPAVLHVFVNVDSLPRVHTCIQPSVLHVLFLASGSRTLNLFLDTNTTSVPCTQWLTKNRVLQEPVLVSLLARLPQLIHEA